MKTTFRNVKYTPIDVWEQRQITRILRALLGRRWVEGGALFEYLSPCDTTEINAVSQSLTKGVKCKWIDRRGVKGSFEYQLTTTGRAEILRRLNPDTAVEYAPARPGSEHLLVAEDECA